MIVKLAKFSFLVTFFYQCFTVVIAQDPPQSLSFPKFDSATVSTYFNLNGSAGWVPVVAPDDSRLILTPDNVTRAGTVMSKTPIALNSIRSYHASFSFYIPAKSGNRTGQGLGFFFAPQSYAPITATPKFLSYGFPTTIPQIFGVRFHTFQGNSFDAPVSQFASFFTQWWIVYSPYSTGTKDADPNREYACGYYDHAFATDRRNDPYYCENEYFNCANKTVYVWVEAYVPIMRLYYNIGNATKPSNPRVLCYSELNIVSANFTITGTNFHFGFGAATDGQAWQEHSIKSLELKWCVKNGTFIDPETGLCICAAGHYSLNGECIPCPVNTYKMNSGDGNCTPCPEGAVDPDQQIGRVFPSHCVCPQVTPIINANAPQTFFLTEFAPHRNCRLWQKSHVVRYNRVTIQNYHHLTPYGDETNALVIADHFKTQWTFSQGYTVLDTIINISDSFDIALEFTVENLFIGAPARVNNEPYYGSDGFSLIVGNQAFLPNWTTSHGFPVSNGPIIVKVDGYPDVWDTFAQPCKNYITIYSHHSNYSRSTPQIGLSTHMKPVVFGTIVPAIPTALACWEPMLSYHNQSWFLVAKFRIDQGANLVRVNACWSHKSLTTSCIDNTLETSFRLDLINASFPILSSTGGTRIGIVGGNSYSSSKIRVLSWNVTRNDYPDMTCTAVGGVCTCKSGFEPLINAIGCKRCDQNYFKGTAGNELCSICGEHSGTLDVGATSCICLPGYYFDDQTSKCVSCPLGYWKNTTTNNFGDCIMCPRDFSTTVQDGAILPDECVCMKGYYFTNTACEPCSVDTYKDAESNEGECQQCPVGSSTFFQTGSTSLTDCMPLPVSSSTTETTSETITTTVTTTEESSSSVPSSETTTMIVATTGSAPSLESSSSQMPSNSVTESDSHTTTPETTDESSATPLTSSSASITSPLPTESTSVATSENTATTEATSSPDTTSTSQSMTAHSASSYTSSTVEIIATTEATSSPPTSTSQSMTADTSSSYPSSAGESFATTEETSSPPTSTSQSMTADTSSSYPSSAGETIATTSIVSASTSQTLPSEASSSYQSSEEVVEKSATTEETTSIFSSSTSQSLPFESSSSQQSSKDVVETIATTEYTSQPLPSETSSSSHSSEMTMETIATTKATSSISSTSTSQSLPADTSSSQQSSQEVVETIATTEKTSTSTPSTSTSQLMTADTSSIYPSSAGETIATTEATSSSPPPTSISQAMTADTSSSYQSSEIVVETTATSETTTFTPPTPTSQSIPAETSSGYQTESVATTITSQSAIVSPTSSISILQSQTSTSQITSTSLSATSSFSAPAESSIPPTSTTSAVSTSSTALAASTTSTTSPTSTATSVLSTSTSSTTPTKATSSTTSAASTILSTTTTSTTSTLSTTAPTPSPTFTPQDSQMDGSVIVGIALGGSVCVAGAAFGFVWMMAAKKKKGAGNLSNNGAETATDTTAATDTSDFIPRRIRLRGPTLTNRLSNSTTELGPSSSIGPEGWTTIMFPNVDDYNQNNTTVTQLTQIVGMSTQDLLQSMGVNGVKRRRLE